MEWVKRHFKQIIGISNMQNAYSNSQHIKQLVDAFVEEPDLLLRNGEAISIAMAIFSAEAFEEDSILDATTSAPFIERGYRSGVINSYVNKSFNAKEYITRADTIRLIFRLSGLKLRKKFGMSLLENFAVKSPVFPNIKENHPAYGHVLYMQNKGLLQGYEAGAVKADDYIERRARRQQPLLCNNTSLS